MNASRNLFLLCVTFLSGCLHAPVIHPRALESNELCAQYINLNDLVKAEVQCDLGLQFSPQYGDLWNNKGLIYLKREQIDPAKEHFIKALRYNQEQAQAYNNLGFIYLNYDKKYGKAEENFLRALKVNPDYTEARYNLGVTYMRANKKEKARKEFRTIIAINNNLADPHHWLGVMALEEKKYNDAIEELHKTTALDPTYADAWYNLGLAYGESGKLAEAKDAITSCLEADTNHVQCRQALPIYSRKALLLDPTLKEIKEHSTAENTPGALLALGRTFREKGLRNEEERAYRKCVKLDGKYAPCHYGLYEVFNEERREKEAMVACKNFLKFAVADEFPREIESCEKFVNSRP
ncbi:MAG: tetratricopeptide repeat protein [Myxococcaceae bacterium]